MASKNKILFVTSFYSGLQHSIQSNKWEPNGMPAIYKLLERLELHDLKFDYVFIQPKYRGTKIIENSRFPNSLFYIIGSNTQQYNNFLLKFISKSRSKISILKALANLKLDSYSLVYFDRASSEYRLFIPDNDAPKTILRLHGVGKLVQNYSSSFLKKLKSWYKIKGFRSYYDYIIASNDGTPVDKFFKLYTNNGSPRIKLLNGVDLYNLENTQRQNSIITFLFIGRLEADKGINETINAFKKASNPKKNKLLIIGDGSLSLLIKTQIQNTPNIELIGNVGHSEINKYYIESDILISLNHLGNISNVVLEAINYGLGIVTFNKNEKKDQDVETHEFLGDNPYYIDRSNTNNSLTEAITEITNSPNLAHGLKQKVRSNLKPKLKSWEERIDLEISIIKSLSNNK